MEDTLRYFFSAIFQGIAAILTLGAMFYMNYNDKIKSRIAELEKEVDRIYQPGGIDLKDKVLKSNIIEVMRDHYLPLHKDQINYNHHRVIVQEYETIVKRQETIGNIIPYLLLKGLILLIVSSTALFCIGLNDIINFGIFVVGLLVLLTTYSFLLNLNKVIVKSIYSTSKKNKI